MNMSSPTPRDGASDAAHQLSDTQRFDGRGPRDMRRIDMQPRAQRHPEGSVIVGFGNTRVMVAASIEDKVPDWMRGQGRGWITAEYAMHPRANPTRQRREGLKGSVSGRTHEIQRLIGRSLRAAVDLNALGERNIVVDCDVLDADGGTRTAAITGGFVALVELLAKLREQSLITGPVLHAQVAAVSAGIVDGRPLVDLCYAEDHRAEVDLNVVATADGRVIEIQGSAEDRPMARRDFDALVDGCLEAMPQIAAAQQRALQAMNLSLDGLLRTA